MDKDIIIQSLTDAFEVIKDSWPSKKDSIINCIIEIEKYNRDMAIDMWLYILQKNKEHLKTREGIEYSIDNLLQRIHNKYGIYLGNQYRVKAFIEHLFPQLLHKKEIIKLIFCDSYNAGATCIYDLNIHCLIASILLSGDTEIVSYLMESLRNNKHLDDMTIGTLMRKSFEAIEDVHNNQEIFDRRYELDPKVKDLLLNSIDSLENKEDRAECTIAFLSI